MDYACQVETYTLSKANNLVLNVDGAIGSLFLDLLSGSGMFTKQEIDEIVEIGYLNGLFVLARSIGLIGWVLVCCSLTSLWLCYAMIVMFGSYIFLVWPFVLQQVTFLKKNVLLWFTGTPSTRRGLSSRSTVTHGRMSCTPSERSHSLRSIKYCCRLGLRVVCTLHKSSSCKKRSKLWLLMKLGEREEEEHH